MTEYPNEYLDEVRRLGLPCDGRPIPASRKQDLDALERRFGFTIVTPASLQPVAEHVQRLGLEGVVAIGSGRAYAESRLVRWFGLDVRAFDKDPHPGTPTTTFGVRVEQGNAEIAACFPGRALFMSFPTVFGLSCLRSYHDSGGRLVVYAGTLLEPRVGEQFFAYLAEHSAHRRSRAAAGRKKSRLVPAPLSEVHIPTLFEKPESIVAGEPAGFRGGKARIMRRLQLHRPSSVLGRDLSRREARDVVQVWELSAIAAAAS